MPNANRPRGARAVRRIDGGACLPSNPYTVDASNGTAIFVGDFVKLEADGNVAPAAAGNALIGVVTAVADDYDNLARRYLPASTAGTVWVNDDPEAVFVVQEDDGGTALTAAARGANVDIVAGTGNTTTSISGHELDQDSVGVTTGQLRLLRLVDTENNDYGDNADWEVRINEHQSRTIAGV